MKSVVRWLNRELRYKVAAPLFILSLAIFSSAVIPLLVTVDGIVYIANAKSILTSDFANIYTFYREPGYPLFLKWIHYFGDAGLLLVFCQSALMASSGLIAFYSLSRLFSGFKPKMWELLALWLILLNPMWLSYSGAVLQQPLFSFQLAVFALLLSLAIKESAKFPRWLIGVFTLCWYVLGIATSIGWMYLGLLPVSATVILLLKPSLSRLIHRLTKRKLFENIVVFASIPLIVLATYTIGRQTFQSWEDFKSPYLSQEVKEGYVIKPLSTVPYIPTPVEMTRRTMSLMNMIVIEPYEKENNLFMGLQTKRESPSSSWDSAWEVEPQASYALNYFVVTNPGEILHNGYARLATSAPWLYQGAFIAMWALALGLLVFRKWKPLAIFVLVPINFLLVYAASNSPIDRYGIPTWSFAASAVILGLSLGIAKIKNIKL